MAKKIVGINRIVDNVKVLSNPVAQECFFYECEDPEGLSSVLDEIDELRDCLPEGIELADLPFTYCGNKKTKIFGLATCEATQGHQIVIEDAPNRVIFEDEGEAMRKGYRPCKRCMLEAYLKWEYGIENNGK